MKIQDFPMATTWTTYLSNLVCGTYTPKFYNKFESYAERMFTSYLELTDNYIYNTSSNSIELIRIETEILWVSRNKS